VAAPSLPHVRHTEQRRTFVERETHGEEEGYKEKNGKEDNQEGITQINPNRPT
jgi:hypothetical protein